MTDEKDVLSMSVRDFVSAAAAKTPTPGGGSVAGVVGSLAVALSQMALNFTRGKKKFAEHAQYHEKLADRLENAGRMFLDLVHDDIQAYEMYQKASAEKSDDQEALQLATAAAINVPREMTKLALAVLADLRELVDKCNTWLISDLLAGGTLAVAAVRLSDYNVRINMPNVSDRDSAAEIRKAAADDLAKAVALIKDIEEAAGKYID